MLAIRPEHDARDGAAALQGGGKTLCIDQRLIGQGRVSRRVQYDSGWRQPLRGRLGRSDALKRRVAHILEVLVASLIPESDLCRP